MVRESVGQRHVVEPQHRVLEKAEEMSCYRRTFVQTTLLYNPGITSTVEARMYHNDMQYLVLGFT